METCHLSRQVIQHTWVEWVTASLEIINGICNLIPNLQDDMRVCCHLCCKFFFWIISTQHRTLIFKLKNPTPALELVFQRNKKKKFSFFLQKNRLDLKLWLQKKKLRENSAKTWEGMKILGWLSDCINKPKRLWIPRGENEMIFWQASSLYCEH